MLLLAGSGLLYRILALHLERIEQNPRVLPIPLSSFPTMVNGWVGKDVPISQAVQRVARNDDFLSRHYSNETSNQWVNVYVAYSGRPATMLGHRPRVCYAAGGWVHDDTERSQVNSLSGKPITCLIHRFHRPAPAYDEVVVLNFYIVNGRITADEAGFSGVAWRTPSVAGAVARYVAQVQISSTMENSVRQAARDLTDMIMGFFPDQNGHIEAVQLDPGLTNTSKRTNSLKTRLLAGAD